MIEFPEEKSMNESLRALFVDDSRDDVELLVNDLKRNGYYTDYSRVDTYESLKMALGKGQWDIILVDCSLPQFTGMEAIRMIKESRLDIPVIVISGRREEQAARVAMSAGACDYISKNQLSRLIPVIERELKEARQRQVCRKAAEDLRIAKAELESSLSITTATLHALSQALEREERSRQMVHDTYNSLIENSIQALTLFNQDGRMIFANRRTEEITGYSVNELLAMSGDEIMAQVHHEDRHKVQKYIQDRITGKAVSQTITYRFIKKSGEIRWGEQYAAISQYEGKKVLQSSFIDVTDRKKI